MWISVATTHCWAASTQSKAVPGRNEGTGNRLRTRLAPWRDVKDTRATSITGSSFEVTEMNRDGTLPTEAEINVYDSLDERAAVLVFYGKTLEEAEELFRENSLRYQEGLMWMGPKAFDYYMDAAINYVKSPAGVRDEAMVHAITSILDYRLDNGDIPQASLPKLLALVEWVVDNYDRFSMDPVYVDTKEKYLRLRDRMRGARN